MMKKQEKFGHDIDKALAKAGSVSPPKNKKQVEEEQHKRMKGEK